MALSFNGWVFRDHGCPVTSVRIEDPSTRGEALRVPRSNRAREVDGYLGPRVVVLEGIARGSTASLFRTAKNDLLRTLNPTRGYANFTLDDDRYLRCRPLALPSLVESGRNDGWASWSARLQAADPYWYATSATTDSWSMPAQGDTKALTGNAGTEPAQPTVTVTAASTGTMALVLTNGANSDALRLDGEVTAGDVIAVNTLAQTVTLNGSNARSLMSGDWLSLEPGANTLTLTTLAGVTLTSIVLSWRFRWL